MSEIVPADSNDDDYAISTINIGSVGSQVAVGGVSGWCIGHVCKRVGILAATTLGGGLLALKIASDRGYIKINWGRVNTDLQRAADRLKEATNNQEISSSQAMEEMKTKVCYK
ncbi:uncharacterized protein TRIADDRAFT_60503 [Trichoplax adhaerens]|uniref:FUN14 domain-containing protein 1 n=1 Tax=Trichoplax adhaerens TaxID=10228 RepID=B3S8D7_TRIAD|nr:predicted protein [Trichoplax adhaerens]EDV21087.1 predicted protein [Trichoplax adhaerens]|eukprot:XP_002116417.1 predicted protein [Trichoplax adhaerens]